MEKWLPLSGEGWNTHRRTDFRKDAMNVAQAQDDWQDIVNIVWLVGILCVAHFGLIWAIWAFLARGGLTFRLAGIALLRSNGRKALRVQCAWRALLVWLPVTALLVLSVWLH